MRRRHEEHDERAESRALRLDLKDQVRGAQLARGERVPPHETQRLTRAGELRGIALLATALLHERGQPHAVATTERSAG